MSMPPAALPSVAKVVPANVWYHHILLRVKSGQDLASLAATSSWLRRMIVSPHAQKFLWPYQFSRELLQCDDRSHQTYVNCLRHQLPSVRRMTQAVLHNNHAHVMEILEYCGVMYQAITQLRTLDELPIDQRESVVDNILVHLGYAGHAARAEILCMADQYIRRGTDVNYALKETGETALHRISYALAPKNILNFLLRRGADPHKLDRQGCPALN